MPLTHLQVEEKSQWAIWHITESEHELNLLVNESVPEEIVSPTKRLEWLASRLLTARLLKSMDISYKGLSKNEFGKPNLVGYPHYISLTHSYPYVAVQVSNVQEVGIDLEQPKEKLLRIAKRVLSAAEHEDAGINIVKHCIYWSAKEALYKIYGKRGLHFIDQLNIEPFTVGTSGKLFGVIADNFIKQQVTLSYRVQADYVFVYTLNSHP